MTSAKSKLSLGSLGSRLSQERKKLISSSLTTSQSLSARLVPPLGDDDRTRPCSMKFHKEWKHPNCEVTKWYHLQTRSSTQFTSIQHWSNNVAPFFHEYLLIKLADGAICRVERVGEGSRTNAISRVGCNAHDIIQWYPAGGYDNSSFDPQQPKLIIEVIFPRSFDLLDVLAICYSVQQHRTARSYTLQRFNCYFLCSTILAILTRRISEQEVFISDVVWTDVVRETLHDLSHVKYESVEHVLSFSIFSLLRPSSADPADFFLESLRSQLDSAALCSLNTEISGTLWRKNMQGAVENALLPSVNKAITAVLESKDPSSVELRNVLPRFGEDLIPITDPNARPIQKKLSKLILNAYTETLKSSLQHGQERYTMRKLEAKHSLGKRLSSTIFRSIVVYPPAICKALVLYLRDKEAHKFVRHAYLRYHRA